MSVRPGSTSHFSSADYNSRIICMKSATSETIKFGRFEFCATRIEYSTAPVEYLEKFNWCFKHRNFHAPNSMHKLCLFTWSRQTGFFLNLAQKVKCCVTVHHGVNKHSCNSCLKLRNILVLTAAHIIVHFKTSKQHMDCSL